MTFSVIDHSPTSATGTPWHATQRAAWEALKKGGRANDEAIFIMAPHRAPN